MRNSPLTAKEECRSQSFCFPSGEKTKTRLALPYVHVHLDSCLELQNALMSRVFWLDPFQGAMQELCIYRKNWKRFMSNIATGFHCETYAFR